MIGPGVWSGGLEAAMWILFGVIAAGVVLAAFVLLLFYPPRWI